jgi:hypothetical protein
MIKNSVVYKNDKVGWENFCYRRSTRVYRHFYSVILLSLTLVTFWKHTFNEIILNSNYHRPFTSTLSPRSAQPCEEARAQNPRTSSPGAFSLLPLPSIYIDLSSFLTQRLSIRNEELNWRSDEFLSILSGKVSLKLNNFSWHHRSSLWNSIKQYKCHIDKTEPLTFKCFHSAALAFKSLMAFQFTVR